MPRYRFDAVTDEGVPLTGALEASDDRSALRQLERRGLAVVKLVPEDPPLLSRGTRNGRLRQAEVILALYELATMLKAGVPLAEAVQAQARSGHPPRLVAAFEAVAQGLRRGQSFSEALVATGLPLPPYVPTLLRAGEQSGMLARALADAVDQLKYDQAVRGEIRQALTYPAVLVVAGLGAIILMFTFVVPKFASLLDRSDELPWLAWAVLSGGMMLRDNLWILGTLISLGMVALARWLALPGNRDRLTERLEALPVLGTWRVESETAAWARVLGTLLGNRVPLMDALALSLDSVSSPRRRMKLRESTKAVRSGMSLADALEQQATLTSTGYNLIRVGERSGELPAMLQSLSQLCQEAGRSRMKQFLALLEPLAILVIGSVIGLIMIGIILAITSVNELAI